MSIYETFYTDLGCKDICHIVRGQANPMILLEPDVTCQSLL